jgi:aminoglycoside phosphotransferase family enzyme
VQTIVDALLSARCYPHEVDCVRLIETHISWLLLTGEYAYKIKKPVMLGFVDFSTLERRRHFCHEEVRLNRRLAPDIYLDVVPICGTLDAPVVGGAGAPIEYAVKMRQFRQQDLFDVALSEDRIDGSHIDQLAAACARFHAETPIADPATDYARPSTLLNDALENFGVVAAALSDAITRAPVARLETWTRNEYQRLVSAFWARRDAGRIRECHGDMHLANIALIDGHPTPFDCIEFNDNLRWIDVMSEVAFVMMDLCSHARDDLAYRFLDRYLELSGDFEGIAVLPYYFAYRAMVRAKIDAIRMRAQGVPGATLARDAKDLATRVAVADSITIPASPFVAITYGLSGSGKSHLSERLLAPLRAVRIRSDVERKRVHGLPPDTRSSATLTSRLYNEQATEATFARLAQLATTIVAGHRRRNVLETRAARQVPRAGALGQRALRHHPLSRPGRGARRENRITPDARRGCLRCDRRRLTSAAGNTGGASSG